MPARRKIDLYRREARDWLEAELIRVNFSDYDGVTERFIAKLEELGEESTISKSAVHAYGQDFEAFAKAQEQASLWAADWMSENGLEEEAKRHNVLFQMVTTLAFKVMQAQMSKDGDEIKPQDLQLIGRMLKDVMSSSGIREKLVADERARIARETRETAAREAGETARQLGLTGDTIAAIKASILGVTA